jgi:hypothetical protein
VPRVVKLLVTIEFPNEVGVNNSTPANVNELVSSEVVVIAPLRPTMNPGLLNPD